MLLDRQGRCLKTNKTGVELMRLPESELARKDFRDLWPEENRNAIDAAVQKALAGGQCSVDAYRIKGTDTIWFALTIAPIFDESQRVTRLIAIATDITHRRMIEEERAAHYEQRIAVEKQHSLEREKFLMDLHDGIGGITTNISILAELGQKTSNAADLQKSLGTIADLSREALAEVRNLMHSLDSKELNWHTLATELRAQGTKLLEPHGITLKFEKTVADGAEQPNSLFWVNVFRIYKEALTNIIKHAKADAVTLTMAVTESGIRLTIQDNGIGQIRETMPGRGISNMRKRIAEVGGTVLFTTNNGMRIQFDIPLPLRTVLAKDIV